jgi:hypothetical protein
MQNSFRDVYNFYVFKYYLPSLNLFDSCELERLTLNCSRNVKKNNTGQQILIIFVPTKFNIRT